MFSHVSAYHKKRNTDNQYSYTHNQLKKHSELYPSMIIISIVFYTQKVHFWAPYRVYKYFQNFSVFEQAPCIFDAI
jgi:hypothetical protein